MANSILILDIPIREIKYLLKLRGINQIELAKQADVSYTALNKFLSESDKRAPLYKKSPHIRKAIADALGIPMEELTNKETISMLITQEMERIKQKELSEKRRYFKKGKHHWNLRRFFKNLINLGQPGYYFNYKKHEE